LYEARWLYGIKYRKYYLFGLRKRTSFIVRQMSRYKKGTPAYGKLEALQMLYSKSTVFFLFVLF
jgi:hypothetical protein